MLRGEDQVPLIVQVVWGTGPAKRTKAFGVRRHAWPGDADLAAGALDAAMQWAREQGLAVRAETGICRNGQCLGHPKLTNALGVAGVFWVWVAWRHAPSLVVKGIWPDPVMPGRYVQIQRSVLVHGLEAALQAVVRARLAAHPDLAPSVDVGRALAALRREWERGPPDGMRRRYAQMDGS